MKALTSRIFLSNNYKPLLRWERLNASRYLRLLYAVVLSLGKSISQSLSLTRLGRAVLVALHGLSALALSATANKRLYVGLVLIGILAPLSGCMYLLFDREVKEADWYYVNNFYLFLVLGPSIKDLFIAIGVYHLFPNKSKRAFLLSLPMGFAVGKIIWLVSVSSNEQFYEILPYHIIFIGVLISAVLLFSVEWFAWRSEHRVRAFDKRLDGLFQIVDEESISADKFRSMFRTTYQQKKNFHKEY